MKVRIEKDELGIKEIPAEAYYGIPEEMKETARQKALDEVRELYKKYW